MINMPYFGYQHAAFGGNSGGVLPYEVADKQDILMTEYEPETGIYAPQANAYFQTRVLTGTQNNVELNRVAVDCHASLTTAYAFGYGWGMSNVSGSATKTISIEVNGVEATTFTTTGNALAGNGSRIEGTGTGTKTAIMLADTTGGSGTEFYGINMTGVAVLGATGQGSGVNQFPKLIDSDMVMNPLSYTATNAPSTAYLYKEQVASTDANPKLVVDSDSKTHADSQAQLAIAQCCSWVKNDTWHSGQSVTISLWFGGEELASASSSASPWYNMLEATKTWTERGEMPTMGFQDKYPVFEVKLTPPAYGTKGIYSRTSVMTFRPHDRISE